MKHQREDIKNGRLHSAIFRFKNAHRKKITTEFSKVSLTQGKPKILDLLADNPGCSQKELAKYCEIEPATATGIITAMEKEGLVYRERNKKDKRILNVYLTERGKEMQKYVEEVFQKVDEKCFEGFSEEEKIQTLNYINRIYENLIK